MRHLHQDERARGAPARGHATLSGTAHRRRSLAGSGVLALSAAAALAGSAGAPDGVDPSHLALADCPGEPGCPAVVLLDETVIDNRKLQARSSRRRVVKVFTAEGIAEHADVHVTETIGYEMVNHLSGRAFLPDGTVIPLDQDNVSVKAGLRKGRFRQRVTSARFAGVVPGAILEHSYDLVDPRESNYLRYRWEVQEAIPVLRRTLALKQGEVQLGWVQQGLERFALDTANPIKNVHRFTFADLPSLPREPFSPPEGVIRASVQFYPPVGRLLWLGLLAGEISRETGRFIHGADAVGARVRDLASPEAPARERMKALYRFVQEQIGTEEERAEQTSEEKVKDAESADEVLKRRYGSEFERTLLFLAMATKAGLDAHLVLAADRRETILDPQLPTPFNFTAYLAGVKDGDKWSFFDPGTRYCPYGTVAAHKQSGATNAMAVRPAPRSVGPPGRRAVPPSASAYVMVTVPHTGASRNVLVRDALVRLAADGSGDVEVRDQGAGLVDLDHREAYGGFDDDGRRRLLAERMGESLPAATVTESSFEDLDSTEHPATIRYRLAVRDLAPVVGSRMLLTPALFDAGERNPFTAERRRTPVQFAHTKLTIETITFELPGGFRVAETPSAENIRDGPFALAAEYRLEDGRLVLSRRLEIDAAEWPAGEYGRLKAFRERVQQADRRTVVLESGAGPGPERVLKEGR